jgi:hypothetical protein
MSLETLKSDIETLKRARRGVPVTEENKRTVRRLASLGLMNLGTEEVGLPNGMIELRGTARTNGFGRRAIRGF